MSSFLATELFCNFSVTYVKPWKRTLVPPFFFLIALTVLFLFLRPAHEEILSLLPAIFVSHPIFATSSVPALVQYLSPLDFQMVLPFCRLFKTDNFIYLI